MNIENPYLPVDQQDIDNITTLYEEGERQYDPGMEEKLIEESREVFIFLAVGVLIMIACLVSYLNFTN